MTGYRSMDDGDASPPPSRLGLFLHEASRPVDWRRALNTVIASLKSRFELIRTRYMLTSPVNLGMQTGSEGSVFGQLFFVRHGSMKREHKVGRISIQCFTWSVNNIVAKNRIHNCPQSFHLGCKSVCGTFGHLAKHVRRFFSSQRSEGDRP